MTRDLRATVGDYVTLVRGTTYKGRLVGAAGPALLGLGSIEPGGGFRTGRYKTYGGECPPELMLFPGDIYASLKGATKDGKMIGSVARVPATVASGRLTQDTVKLVLRSPSTEEATYLYWVLRTPQYRDYCEGRAMGSAVVALSRTDFLSYPVPAPTAERLEVVTLLERIEEKLELNRRMNQTLEWMARALFQSWFINFDPVRMKAACREEALPKELSSLFPESLEDSELGPIPSGWGVADLGSCSRRIAMGPFGSDIKTDNFVEAGVPVIREGNLTHGFVDDNFVFVSETKADELRNANAFRGDIVLTHRGTLGQVGMIPLISRYPRYVVSQSQMLLSVNPKVASPRYVFDYLRSAVGRHALLANTSQTGVPAISRPTTSLKAIRLLLPPIDLLNAYDRIAQALVAREVSAATESRTLAALRNALLPQLLSGRLRPSGGPPQ